MPKTSRNKQRPNGWDNNKAEEPKACNCVAFASLSPISLLCTSLEKIDEKGQAFSIFFNLFFHFLSRIIIVVYHLLSISLHQSN